MPRKEYYRKSTLCPRCAFHRPEGKRPGSMIDPDTIWKEACGLYGYSFWQDLEPADFCEGFRTPEQVEADKARQEALKKQRKNKK